MLPLLPAGALIIAWPLPTQSSPALRRGMVVVAKRPDRPSIEVVKRIHALPGEQVRFPNGSTHTLKPDEYFLTGDNPAASTDSHQFGPVRRELITAGVRWRYWPLPPRRL